MPTVLSKGGFDVRIYFNDHAPPHVHVNRRTGEARIGLIPVIILNTHGLSRAEAANAKRMVEGNLEFLLSRWTELHGQAIDNS